MRRDTALGRFSSRLFDILATTEYHVESSGIRSPDFKLTAVDLPAVGRTSATIQYPGYTALPPETIPAAGDLAVLTGSTVSLSAALTRPARSASLVIEGREPVAMTLRSDGRWSAGFKVSADAFWRIDLVTDDGRRITGLQYAIDALADQPPTVRFAAPGRDTKASPIEEVTAETEASDDLGIRKLFLHVSINGGPDSSVTLADTTVKQLKDLAAAHTFFLEEWSLKPGDLVAYFAEATDGAGQIAKSDIYFLEIRPFDKSYREAEQHGGQPAGGGESAEGLSERQRQVVVGTFNVLRDSTAQAKEFRENVTPLAIGEGRLREDVSALSQRLRTRRMAAVDSTFVIIAASLDTATAELTKSEERLGQVKPRDALPAAQRALTHLQRAEAAYREVRVAAGNQQGGGGAGGKQQSAEELADLFELETDKLKNQYESVQRESSQQAERQLDETIERLRKLATRQEQENERAQRMADALRNRSTPSGGGGGGAAQRQLAQETEDAARQLERLAREKNNPSLADAARRLKDAADQMRKAAAANPGQSSAQSGSALEQLKGAARGIERSRAQSRQDEIKALGARGQDIRDRQKEAGEQAMSLPTDPAARAERQKPLEARKDVLAGEVERLEADADRLSKDAAREQPAAARKLAEAAEGLRTNRVRDKLVFSKQLAQRGSGEYIRSFEEQIGKNLDDAVERLRAAGGSLESSAGDRKSDALDKARGLVRGMQSLAERARAAQQDGDKGQQSGQGSDKGEPGQTNGTPSGRMSPDQARQFGREFRARRQAAESLRADLRAMGQDTKDLDRLLAEFRAMDSPRTFGDPKGLEGLERDLIAGLKDLEFALWRRLGDEGAGDRPAAGASAQVPPQYRELVEEYYRSLARKRARP